MTVAAIVAALSRGQDPGSQLVDICLETGLVLADIAGAPADEHSVSFLARTLEMLFSWYERGAPTPRSDAVHDLCVVLTWRSWQLLPSWVTAGMMYTLSGKLVDVVADQWWPKCNRCAAPMVVRTARRGPRPGGRFLGCAAYPQCKTTQNLRDTGRFATEVQAMVVAGWATRRRQSLGESLEFLERPTQWPAEGIVREFHVPEDERPPEPRPSGPERSWFDDRDANDLPVDIGGGT